MCTLIIDALLYAVLLLCCSMWNAGIRGSICEAAGSSSDWGLAKFDDTIDIANVPLNLDESSNTKPPYIGLLCFTL